MAVRENKWQESLDASVDYQEEHPDVLITQKTKYHGLNLGKWISNQRTAKNRGTLSAERIKRLEEAGIVWDAREEAWQAGYRAFVAYKEEHGDVPIPAKAKYNGYNLGEWVHTQRGTYEQGTLSVERIEQLDDVGFVWRVRETALPTIKTIDMLERGESIIGGLSKSIKTYLKKKYNNTCAIGQVDLNDFTILPRSKQILAGKNCGYKGTKPNSSPNLEIAHLDDDWTHNTIANLLPLCPNHHGEINYSNGNKSPGTLAGHRRR